MAGPAATAATVAGVVASTLSISVVIPCLNEEAAVGEVVDQAWEGIRAAGLPGEVIVVDNGSTDRSAEIAAGHGATVVLEERRGYGSAYLAGLAHAKGEFIVMGDADETYPMRELAPFVDRLVAGDDLVIGSRFAGTIHGDAMPWLNRNVGNPILTRMLNVMFGVKISDAHCGMRALRKDALRTLDLHSTGMEFASEMVFKAFRRELTVTWRDGWRHLRFMLLYSPRWLFLLPGLLLTVLGLAGMLLLAGGPIDVLGRTWQIHTMLALVASTLIGAQILQLWVFARTYGRIHFGEPDPLVERLGRHVTLERGLLAGAALCVIALVALGAIVIPWLVSGLGELRHEYATALALTLLGLGTQIVFGSFFMSLLTMRTTDEAPTGVVVHVGRPPAAG